MISAIILAAGMSTRMGRLKQLIEINNKPLIVHTLELALSCPFQEVILVLGHRAEEVREAVGRYVSLDKLRIVINRDYSMGISTSLKVGVMNLSPSSEAFMVFLSDQPFVRRETVLMIMREYLTKRPLMVVPTYRGIRGNPVLVDRRLVREIMELTGDVGARVLVNRYSEVILLETGDPGVIIDIDTPEDLRRIQKY